MPRDLGPLEGRTFAAVIFDMDGTLIDSTPSVERSWLRWTGEWGLDPQLLVGNHGVPAMGIIAKVLPPEKHAAALESIEAIEIADVEGITILPGAAEALHALVAAPGAQPRSAIATSCTAGLAEARIAATGLDHPDVVVTASDVTHGKPDPEPFLLAARRLGVDPAQCLVAEDAPAGLAAAKAAGCATIALTTTSSREAMDADPNADVVLDSLAEVRFEATPDGVRVVAADPAADGRRIAR
ncbi:MAG: HAD-IA family hydrolase [Micrococcales bacterium]|nr:HAD-IA family hydrolase [Micrococcales bacterium]